MSSQSVTGGQQLQPSHEITNAGASGARGSSRQDEIARLAESEGYNQDLTATVKSQVIPVWSDPDWNGTYQTVTDGFTFKARQLGTGDFVRGSRPAIRPEDDARNPTEYARRFGFLPRQAIRDAWDHSGLTPTDPFFQTSFQQPEDDAYDESLQSVFFGLTSAELVAQGAFNPRLPISWPPDINETVHDLFARYRWDHTKEPAPGYWEGVWDVRYGSVLNGTPGVYNALTNQVVWDAIEPALKLASRIIRSDHPYWQAMTSMFHLRPVPAAKDGRTLAQRVSQGGTPYTSIWLNDDVNDPRIPAPYPEMARLKALGFDSAASRDVCMDILSANLRFNLFSMDSTLGMNSHWGDWNLTISLNASLIWPLLMNRHVSNSEKATLTFDLVNSVLHELAHACAVIHRDVTSRDHLIYSTTFGPKVTQELWASMVRLGDQIYGPLQAYFSQPWLDRPMARPQLFVEDEVQGEEGLNLEKQLWGNRVAPHHAFGEPEFTTSVLLTLFPFPTQHPQPLQQGTTPLDQVDRAYDRFLKDPRAPSWNEELTIPVEWYARFFQTGWWQTDFQKFGHHGLKLSTNDPKLPTSLLRTNGQEPAIVGNKDDLAFVFGAQGWDWLYGTLIGTLETKEQYLISIYMQTLIGQAAQAKLFATRFDNEMLSWPVKYRGLVRAARGVSNDYQTMVTVIYSQLQQGSPIFDAAGTGGRIRAMNDSIRRVLGPMLDLSRMMTQDVGYQQYVLTQYLQLDANARATFWNNMQQLSMVTATTLSLLSGQEPNIPLRLAALAPETEGGWVNMLQQKLATDLFGGNARNASLPGDAGAEAQIFVDLLGEIRSLHRSFNVHHNLLNEMNTLTNSATATGRLPASTDWPRVQTFARARSQRRAQVFGPAALRELSCLSDSALVKMVTDAVTLLSQKLDPATLDPARRALQTAEQRATARQAALVEDWRLFLRNEKAMMIKRERARTAGMVGVSVDPTPEELMGRMRTMAKGVADDERLLGTMYSVETVKDTLDLLTLELGLN